jgi:hypothetical protein
MTSLKLDTDFIDEELGAAILSAISDYEEEIRLRNLSGSTNKWRTQGRLSLLSSRAPLIPKYRTQSGNNLMLNNNYRRSY